MATLQGVVDTVPRYMPGDEEAVRINGMLNSSKEIPRPDWDRAGRGMFEGSKRI
jgi:hypothetical protein